MIKVLVLFALVSTMSFGQSYAPVPNQIGSTAIHKDSSIIIAWATNAVVNRGPMNIQNVGAGLASFGQESDALGKADGTSVVSLGDGGEVIVTFIAPLQNEDGPDFVIFENGFVDNYMEFAFVEVSSDGVNFYRFEAISEAPTDTQLSNGSFSDCRYVNNLAGKYRAQYGTPFDLEELDGILGLDINNVTHVKLIDVIGSIDPQYGSIDSQGNLINDPFPTEFPSGGFDLDAVGVIHQKAVNLNELEFNVTIFPNPSNGIFKINSEAFITYRIVDLKGMEIFNGEGVEFIQIDLTSEKNGLYFCYIFGENGSMVYKLTKYE